MNYPIGAPPIDAEAYCDIKYVARNDEKWGLMLTAWKKGARRNAFFFQRFENEARRDKALLQLRNAAYARTQAAQRARQEKAAYRHDYKVGDVLSAMWGYDQTNIDYFVVVATTAKTITVRAIGVIRDYGDAGIDHVRPDKRTAHGEAMRRTVRPGACVTIDSVRVATRWNGSRMYETALGWGH